MYPETASRRQAGTDGGGKLVTNSVDAMCRGTSEGVMLSINVMGMLIAFVAIVALVNACVIGVQGWFNVAPENVVG